MGKFFRGFLCAMRGFAVVVRGERNMRIHLCFTFYVLLAGAITEISAAEWAAVLLCIAAVLAMECVNTAVEQLCDRITTARDERIRDVKDTAAGAVLIFAGISAVVGGIVFFGHGRPAAAWAFASAHPILATALALAVVPLAIWAFRPGKKRDKKETEVK